MRNAYAGLEDADDVSPCVEGNLRCAVDGVAESLVVAATENSNTL